MSFLKHLAIIAGLLVAALASVITGGVLQIDWLKPVGLYLVIFAVGWAFFVMLRSLARRLLWRVGRRLLLSYFLIGVVPIPFVVGLVFVLLYVLSGQLAARRVEAGVAEAVGRLHSLAHLLAQDLPPGLDEEGVATWLRSQRPADEQEGIGWALLEPGKEPFGRGLFPAGRLLSADRLYTALEGIGVITKAEGQGGRQRFLAVLEKGRSRVVLVYWPLEPQLRRTLEKSTHIAVSFPLELIDDGRDAVFRMDGNGLRIDFQDAPASEATLGSATTPLEIPNDLETPSPGAAEADPNPDLDPPDDSSDPDRSTNPFAGPPEKVHRGGLLAHPIVYWTRSIEMLSIDWSSSDWHTAIEGDEKLVPVVVWTSIAREYLELFNSAGGDAMNLALGKGTVNTLRVLACLIGAIYLFAFLLTGILVYRIAKATGRLHRGFAHIERGDFRHRVQLGGRDQLSELVQGFNRMAEHLVVAVEQRAEKEALDRELQVARDLQRSLLPSTNFQAEGFSLAVDFQPAAAIGGDFYHLARWPDGRLIVAIADVSGHGLSTGIVMAAAKALLSALASDFCPCAELFVRLDCELRALTGRRAFVTMALCAFDWQHRQVDFTNAGHLYPYRVTTSGEVSSVANPSRPLGVGLPADFRTVHAPLCPGDLWILLSDGFVEAQSPNGEVFGFERLEQEAAACARLSAEAARDHLMKAWREFTHVSCPEDDRTLLVVRVAEDREVQTVQSEGHLG